MNKKQDYIRKKYKPLQDKTLQNALAHRIGREFPRIGGRRILDLCAEMILEELQQHLRPRQSVGHGQVMWLAVSVDDPPSRGKGIADTDLVPVVLDLSTSEDIDARLKRESRERRLLAKAMRLCQQSFRQGAVLSNCDLAELLGTSDSYIASTLAAHERRTGKIVPRRATIHDVGTGLTHKRIICWKRYAEGKAPQQVARETYHTLEAVDRYLGQFDRVRHCRKHSMSPEETAQILNCSIGLVREYLRIDEELEGENG